MSQVARLPEKKKIQKMQKSPELEEKKGIRLRTDDMFIVFQNDKAICLETLCTQ